MCRLLLVGAARTEPHFGGYLVAGLPGIFPLWTTVPKGSVSWQRRQGVGVRGLSGGRGGRGRRVAARLPSGTW